MDGERDQSRLIPGELHTQLLCLADIYLHMVLAAPLNQVVYQSSVFCLLLPIDTPHNDRVS